MSTQTVNIEHAAHPDWSILNDSKSEMYADLHARFDRSSVPVWEIGQAVEQATAEVVAERHKHENSNVDLLVAPTYDERKRYQELSGNRESIGEYLVFFGGLAMRALGTSQQAAKGTLQLGGMRQFGDWDCTHDLDEFARSIPDAVLSVAPERTQVDRVGDQQNHLQKNQHNRYQYQPLLLDGQEQEGIKYGIIRRRRPAANIYIPGHYPIEVFKESRAVLITSQTDQYTIDLIKEETDQLLEAKHAGHESAVAQAAGNAFERAIKVIKGRTRDVVPITADYFATMRNPAFFPGVELHLPDQT